MVQEMDVEKKPQGRAIFTLHATKGTTSTRQLENALLSLPEVKHVGINFLGRTIEVEYDASMLNAEEIRAFIAKSRTNYLPDILEAKVNPSLTFEMVEDAIRKRSYGVLSTISRDGSPHSAGVSYAVSARAEPLTLYVVTDRRSKKARNIVRTPRVSFVIPIPRRLGFLPPSSIQFQGTADLLSLTDETSRTAFRRSLVTRTILKKQLEQKEEVSTFIRVRPDPVIFTYGVGMSIIQLMKHVEGAASRVEIPARLIENRVRASKLEVEVRG